MRYQYTSVNGVYSPVREWEKPANYTKEKQLIMGVIAVMAIVFICGMTYLHNI